MFSFFGHYGCGEAAQPIFSELNVSVLQSEAGHLEPAVAKIIYCIASAEGDRFDRWSTRCHDGQRHHCAMITRNSNVTCLAI